MPAPTPVIQRQAYRSPAPRGSVASDDGAERKRRIAGLATTSQGLTDEASTTKRVKMGGNDALNPSIGGGGGSAALAAAASLAPAPVPGPTRGAQTSSAAAPNNDAARRGAAALALLGVPAAAYMTRRQAA